MMKTFTTRYPSLFVILSGLALVFCQYLWRFILPGLTDSIRVVFEKVTTCVLAVALLATLGWWREAGFIGRWRWGLLIPFLPLVIIPLLMVVSQLHKFQSTGLAQLALFALLALMTGFAEETIFRGLAVRALLAKGIMPAALLSSVNFGLLHFANLMVGADPLATAMQVVFATLFGFACTAPLLYTGSIWPLVFLHALQDFIAFWATGGITNTSTPTTSDVFAPIILVLPFAVYGIWLLQRQARMTLEKPR